MGLNKSKGDMYSWCSHTFNPIKGRCGYECSYCYVRSFGRLKQYQGPCYLDEKELATNLGKGRMIFVCSMGDMFGPWVPKKWIEEVLKRCAAYPENEYVFQSKNPGRFGEFLFPRAAQTLLGTTIETDRYPGEGRLTLAPSINQRADAMIALKPWKRFVTIEPIMDFDLERLVAIIKAIGPAFVAIGSDSKGHGLVEPTAEKVRSLIDELRRFTSVREKENMRRLLK